uniref:PAP-associated domain-containing protein n=1 Tax=Panagrolaimus sp. ES5 TaxID=591445 RepID=A0AC34G2C7_9BILA
MALHSSSDSDDSDYFSRNDYGTKNYNRRKVQRPKGIPEVKSVPYYDFSKLEGYHPSAFVKPSHGVEENMQIIAKYRSLKPELFEIFDLHIEEYAEENVQGDEMLKLKKEAVEKLQSILPSYDPEQSFHICGSTMTGLGNNASDIDLCWVIPVFSKNDPKPSYPTCETNDFNPIEILLKAKTLIEPHAQPYYVILRDSARVPIIRFTMVFCGVPLRIDININNIAGIYNTFMLANYAKIDERFPMLAKVIRSWGKQSEIINPANGGIYNTFMLANYAKIDERFSRLAKVIRSWGKRSEIINPANGGLSSYAVNLMLLHFLQCGVSPPILPNLLALRHDLFDGTLDLKKLEENYEYGCDLDISIDEWNPSNVGDLLIGFLRYYGFFSYQNDGIFLRLACVDKKNTEDTFLLEEVYDLITVPKVC